MSTASTPIRPVLDPDAVLRLAELPLSLDEIAFVLKTDQRSVLAVIEDHQRSGHEVRRPPITTDSRLNCLASLYARTTLTREEKSRVADLLHKSFQHVIFNLSKRNAELLATKDARIEELERLLRVPNMKMNGGEEEKLVEVITIDEGPKALTEAQIKNMKLLVSKIPVDGTLGVVLRWSGIDQLWKACRLKSNNVFSFLKAGMINSRFPSEDDSVSIVETEFRSLLASHGLAFDMEFDETPFADPLSRGPMGIGD